MRTFVHLSLVLIAIGHPVAGAAATVDPASLPADRSFAIYRNGESIGHRETQFRLEDDALVVETEIKIDVSIAFITVYKRRERHREVYRDGVLVAFEGWTDDDGERFSVSAVRESDGLRIDGEDGTYLAPNGALPATFWGEEWIASGQFFDVKKGQLQTPVISEGTPDTVLLDGRSVAATRYTLDGEDKKVLWYDGDGTLVQMHLAARDGSTVEFRPRGR